MIDPKQKAVVIFERFYAANQPYTFEPKAAKECAKIAIENALWSHDEFGYDDGGLREYWQEVLNELNKM